MNSIAASNNIESVLELLEEEMSVAAFQAAIEELDAAPVLIESLMAVQCVKDAMQGNCRPDRNYSAAIMQFIAAAEAGHAAECGTDCGTERDAEIDPESDRNEWL
ncbi:hypothetical protein [Massilia sp. PWRC2]|uniref:hypothetical protein n=1 Tax=Massilia sp. PWRC2 TaxID=2804626 RepID=UPI003CF7A570